MSDRALNHSWRIFVLTLAFASALVALCLCYVGLNALFGGSIERFATLVSCGLAVGAFAAWVAMRRDDLLHA